MDKAENGFDTMMERGEIILNGYKFVVKPIYLGEEHDYLEDVSYSLYPRVKEEQEPTQKDLSRYAIFLFSQFDRDNEKSTVRKGLFSIIKKWFVRRFIHNYRYYSDNTNIVNLVKWIEKKVYYKKKPIKFYDLERKFGLNKAEILELFQYFQELSGF